MTRLEKAKELHPELSENEVVAINCPEDFLPIDEIPFTECEKLHWDCDACWKKEYKEGEQE